MKQKLAVLKPYLPGTREMLFTTAAFLILLFVGHVAAQTVDSVAGTGNTAKGCNFIKSVETSTLLKVFCSGVALWGVLKWMPTRKEGLGFVGSGIVGFLVVSKFTSVMTVFGMNC